MLCASAYAEVPIWQLLLFHKVGSWDCRPSCSCPLRLGCDMNAKNAHPLREKGTAWQRNSPTTQSQRHPGQVIIELRVEIIIYPPYSARDVSVIKIGAYSASAKLPRHLKLESLKALSDHTIHLGSMVGVVQMSGLLILLHHLGKNLSSC